MSQPKRSFDSLGDYVDVAARLAEFRAKHPEGSLQPADLREPFAVREIGGQTFLVVVAAAYRTPDDSRPGIGMAYEQFPGRTPYTKGSELQNAETSAWGRAIVAALAADTKKGVASADEVRNRQADRDQEEQDTTRAAAQAETAARMGQRIAQAGTVDDLRTAFGAIAPALAEGIITQAQSDQLAEAVRTRKAELEGQTATPTTVPPATQDQHKRMHVLWRQHGLAGDARRGERLARTAQLLGLPALTTSRDLTADQARRVIKELLARTTEELTA